jgi:hypothetical protein
LGDVEQFTLSKHCGGLWVYPASLRVSSWAILQALRLRKSIHHAGFFSESRFDALEICDPLKKALTKGERHAWNLDASGLHVFFN